MQGLDRDVLWWVGGELDGDGSVGVYQQRLKVIMQKSIKSSSTITRLFELFGGSIIKSPARSATEEDQVQWVIRSEEARQFCVHIEPFLFGKRPQFELAATLIIGRSPLIARKGTERKAFKTFSELAHFLQLDFSYDTLRRRFQNSPNQDFGDWSVTKLDKQSILLYRAEVEARLRQMKHVPHLPILNVGSISLAYFCGFIESDGCICILSANSVNIAVSQKYRAICDAFKDKFNGSRVIWLRHPQATLGGIWVWTLSRNSKECIRSLLPYAFEKREQMELVLQVNEDNWRSIKKNLDALKGRRHVDFSKQGKKAKVEEDPDKLSEDALEDLLESAADDSREITKDVQRLSI